MAQSPPRACGSAQCRPGRYGRYGRYGRPRRGAVAWPVPYGHDTAAGSGEFTAPGPGASGASPQARGRHVPEFRAPGFGRRGRFFPDSRQTGTRRDVGRETASAQPTIGRFLGLEALRMVGSTHSTRIQTPKPGFDPHRAGCVGRIAFPVPVLREYGNFLVADPSVATAGGQWCARNVTGDADRWPRPERVPRPAPRARPRPPRSRPPRASRLAPRASRPAAPPPSTRPTTPGAGTRAR
jgi:hypothetical protein